MVNGLRTRNNYCQSKKSDFQRIHLPKLKLYRPLVVTKDIAQILECIVVDFKKILLIYFLVPILNLSFILSLSLTLKHHFKHKIHTMKNGQKHLLSSALI